MSTNRVQPPAQSHLHPSSGKHQNPLLIDNSMVMWGTRISAMFYFKFFKALKMFLFCQFHLFVFLSFDVEIKCLTERCFMNHRLPWSSFQKIKQSKKRNRKEKVNRLKVCFMNPTIQNQEIRSLEKEAL